MKKLNEYETPETDALLAYRRAIEPRAETWDVDDVQSFLKHARGLERKLALCRDARWAPMPRR